MEEKLIDCKLLDNHLNYVLLIDGVRYGGCIPLEELTTHNAEWLSMAAKNTLHKFYKHEN